MICGGGGGGGGDLALLGAGLEGNGGADFLDGGGGFVSILPSCVNLSCKDILVPPRIWRRPPADEGAEGAALPFIVGVAGDEAAQSTAEGKEIMQELPLLTLQRLTESVCILV